MGDSFGLVLLAGFIATLIAYLAFFRAQRRFSAYWQREFADPGPVPPVPSTWVKVDWPREPSTELAGLLRTAERRGRIALFGFMALLLAALAGSLLQ